MGPTQIELINHSTNQKAMDTKENLKDPCLVLLSKVCLQHVPDPTCNMILCKICSEGRDLDPSMREREVPLIRTEGHWKSCHSG